METKREKADPPVDLSKLGVVSSDLKRAAIVLILSNGKVCMRAKELETNVEKMLNRKISDGAFRWHLERLRSEDVIDLKQRGYCITPTGKKISQIVNPALKATLNVRAQP